MISLRDDDCIEPLLDTWRHLDHAASWIWSPRSRPTSDEAPVLNAWGADQVADLLDALRPIARMRRARFNGPPDAPPAPPERTWIGKDTPQASFERALIDAMRAAPGPITTVELVFDLYVWVRTAAARTPMRGWVRNAAYGDLQFEKDDPYGALMMQHTLFRDGATHGNSNTELHRLNRPLLKDALEAIETRLGPIVHVEGLPDVTRTGFASIGER
jgi:hypothetical protein